MDESEKWGVKVVCPRCYVEFQIRPDVNSIVIERNALMTGTGVVVAQPVKIVVAFADFVIEDHWCEGGPSEDAT